ncbi:hypothetical protein GGR77_003972 [Xanthomonas translucens]
MWKDPQNPDASVTSKPNSFRDGTPFDAAAQRTGFSLQLAGGIANFYDWKCTQDGVFVSGGNLWQQSPRPLDSMPRRRRSIRSNAAWTTRSWSRPGALRQYAGRGACPVRHATPKGEPRCTDRVVRAGEGRRFNPDVPGPPAGRSRS